MIYKFCGVVVFMCALWSGNLYAQHNTSSPYSMFGIGELDTRSYSINSGMANTGIGVQLLNFLNNSNPAALCAIDTLTFVFDVATAAKLSYFTEGEDNVSDLNMNLKKIAFGFRASPKVALNLGIRSFSNVGYKMKTLSPVEGTDGTYETQFNGSGGLSRMYLSGSYRINKNLSVGATSSFLFGTINRTETSLQYVINSSSYAKKIYFEFGAQYFNTIDAGMYYTLGATYGYKADISFSNKSTITLNNTSVSELNKAPTKSAIPQYVGLGGSLVSSKGSKIWLFAADYTFSNWGAVTPPAMAPSVKYINSHKVNVGTQYLPNYRTPRNYFQQMQYQLGAFYDMSYLQINGNRLNEYGVTLGLNFPIRNSRSHNLSYINFSADFGYRGGKNLIKENYVMFTAGCSLAEMWFFKRFYE